MKNLLLLFATIVLFITNSSAQQYLVTKITYNDSATIKIIVEKLDDTLTIHSFHWSSIQFSNGDFRNVKISKPGIYYISYRLLMPNWCYFPDQEYSLYIIPGDTIELELNATLNENKILKVNYETRDALNNYFRAKSNRPKDNSLNHFNSFFDPNKESLSISEYIEVSKIADSIIKQNIIFLDNHVSVLPNWFYETEKNNIRYGTALQVLSLYNKLDSGAQALVPFNIVELKNPKAILSEMYYEFLTYYLFYNSPMLNNKLDGTARLINQIEIQKHLVDSIMEGDMKDYFITRRLSGLYAAAKSLDDIKIADNFIKTKYPILPADGLKFINSQRNKMMTSIKTGLQKGDKAPNFYLKDASGKQYNLSSFTGKVVYLNFWKTDCEPFIKEIPNLSKLKSKLAGKAVEIVNICMDNNPEKWKQIIEKEKLTGINLICAGNWESKLKEFYFIEELPHYALIDKNGLIVCNKCSGPADVYSELIKVVNN